MSLGGLLDDVPRLFEGAGQDVLRLSLNKYKYLYFLYYFLKFLLPNFPYIFYFPACPIHALPNAVFFFTHRACAWALGCVGR